MAENLIRLAEKRDEFDLPKRISSRSFITNILKHMTDDRIFVIPIENLNTITA